MVSYKLKKTKYEKDIGHNLELFSLKIFVIDVFQGPKYSITKSWLLLQLKSNYLSLIIF